MPASFDTCAKKKKKKKKKSFKKKRESQNITTCHILTQETAVNYEYFSFPALHCHLSSPRRSAPLHAEIREREGGRKRGSPAARRVTASHFNILSEKVTAPCPIPPRRHRLTRPAGSGRFKTPPTQGPSSKTDNESICLKH